MKLKQKFVSLVKRHNAWIFNVFHYIPRSIYILSH